MESNQHSESLFGLRVDQPGAAYLSETAKWAKFLSIIGFIGCSLLIIAGIVVATSFNELSSSVYSESGVYGNEMMASMGAMIGIMYIIFAIIGFFPYLYLFRFATKMKTAIAANDAVLMTEGFKNLKSTFKFVGVITIIFIGLWVLSLLAGLAGLAAGS